MGRRWRARRSRGGPRRGGPEPSGRLADTGGRGSRLGDQEPSGQVVRFHGVAWPRPRSYAVAGVGATARSPHHRPTHGRTGVQSMANGDGGRTHLCPRQRCVDGAHHRGRGGTRRWLTASGLPARLVGHDGSVRLVGSWPDHDDGELVAPAVDRLGSRTMVLRGAP